MKSSFQSRLQKLEQQRAAKTKINRSGVLYLLPDDYVGERHIVLVDSIPTDARNWEWCTFAEKEGPRPNEAEGAALVPISYGDRDL